MDSGSPPRSSSLAKLYGEIKARKVRQKLAIYLSAALTILGVTNLFSGVYHLRSGIASPSGVKLSYALLRVRKTAEAQKDLNEILSAFDTSGVQYSEGSLVPYILAEAYSVKRNTGNSVRWLLRAMALGYRDYRWASTDPLLETLKADPEGAKALASLTEQFASMRSRVIATDEQE